MSTPGLIMWAVVLLIGVPSAWRNPTAAALVGAWVVTKTIYIFTGNPLAVEFFIFPDICVLAIIFCKPEYNPCEEYLGTLHQLKCIVTERSPADRIVMLIYPVEWALYVSTLHPFYLWWALWGLSLIQFFAAGSESFLHLIRRHAEALDCPPDHSGPLLVAYPGGGRFGG
jgi:hypothetical protein